ncbi:hypothetical protein Pelo_17726 [Pelomyxa schiedti]|nr:hypothetical protein Pelo_17726 [Pelomyxa schiedti]
MWQWYRTEYCLVTAGIVNEVNTESIVQTKRPRIIKGDDLPRHMIFWHNDILHRSSTMWYPTEWREITPYNGRIQQHNHHYNSKFPGTERCSGLTSQ